jgi:hypothetical protein
VALGSTLASARVACRIHAGLLPPSITSVGIVAPLHRVFESGRPL